MNYYNIYTTIDITPTGVNGTSNSNDADYVTKRSQQRNYDTLCQVISLRTNFYDPVVRVFQHDNRLSMQNNRPVFENPNLPDFIDVWQLTFVCDREMVFGENHEALYNDLHMVPIVPALTETVPQFPPYFISYGQLKNVYI